MVTEAEDGAKDWPAMLTWRSPDGTRVESARVQLAGNRIKAHGRIVAAASGKHPAFSASYDLVTDDSGATKRLSVNSSTAERERQVSIARDEENMWLITDNDSESREAFKGAVDVDVMFSPLFTALAIRRTGLYLKAGSVSLPVVYVSLPDLTVVPASFAYSSTGGEAITVQSPVAKTTVAVDGDGFIVDYPGLAERI